MGYGYRTTGAKVGWKNDVQGREKAYAALDRKSLPDRIIEVTERLRGVQIESRPAVDVISKFNYENVLIYCGHRICSIHEVVENSIKMK